MQTRFQLGAALALLASLVIPSRARSDGPDAPADGAQTSAPAFTVRLRASQTRDVAVLRAALERRLARLVELKRFELGTTTVRSDAASGVITVEASLPTGATCDPALVAPLAHALSRQLVRPGDLAFFRVREAAPMAAVQAALVSAGATVRTGDGGGGQLTVTGLTRARIVTIVGSQAPPSGVRYVVDALSPYASVGTAAVEWTIWAVEASPALTGESVATAGVTISEYDDIPQVNLEFTDAGGRSFGALTTELVGHTLGIVFEGGMVTAPLVREPVTGGRAMITIGAGLRIDRLAEAREIAAVLSAGTLSATVEPLGVDAVCGGKAP